MSEVLLGIVIDSLLAGIVTFYIIWDHVKDDRLLTRQVQEFYEDIENLIFFFYRKEIFKVFSDYLEVENEIQISDSVSNEYTNQHFFHMLKVKNKFEEYSKYLGLVMSGEKNVEYINQTYIILSATGLLKRRLEDVILRDYKNIGIEEIREVNTYFKSLREYWKKKHHKFIIKPKLRSRKNFENDIMNFVKEVSTVEILKTKTDYLLQGTLRYQSGNVQDAIDSYNKALKIDPKLVDAWFRKGILYNNIKRYKEAIESYGKAIEINPNNAIIWSYRGSCLKKINRLNEAKENLIKAIEIDDKCDDAYYNLAAVYAMEDNIEMSIKNLKKAIELNNFWKKYALRRDYFNKIKYSNEFQSLITSK